MNPHLEAAAARRHADAESRADTALYEMKVRGDAITFAAVARAARISTDFLYRHPRLRTQIETLRRPNRTLHQPETEPIDLAVQVSSAVRMLSAQIKRMRAEHNEQILTLQRALAAAHGENLRLRRAAHLRPSNR